MVGGIVGHLIVLQLDGVLIYGGPNLCSALRGMCFEYEHDHQLSPSARDWVRFVRKIVEETPGWRTHQSITQNQ